MRRSKGFILAEILTGLLLQAGFILVLCGAFYLLVSFGSGTQQILTARERGQRVISYVDSRIRNAGLGLWKLESSSSYRDAFNLFISEGKKPLALNNNSKKLRLPVALTFRDKDDLTDDEMKAAEPNKTIPNSPDIQYGNILTLLYAERETDIDLVVKKNEGNILGLDNKWTDDLAKEFIRYKTIYIAEGERIIRYNILRSMGDSISNSLYGALCFELDYINLTRAGRIANMKKDMEEWKNKKYPELGFITAEETSYEFIAGDTQEIYKQSNFFDENNNRENYIQSYGVMIGTGKPIFIKAVSSDKLDFYFNDDVTINNADELLYLKGERMFIYIDGNGERNFSFQDLTDDWSDKRYPHQKDILEIYMELDRNTNIFTLYVLASGGTDGRTHERPSSWPKYARPSASNWNKSDYRYHVMYVSKASWKLHNIPDGFTWN